MPKSFNHKIRIASTGMYLPENVYDNDAVIERIRKFIKDPSDPRFAYLDPHYIESTTGIKQRHYADMFRENDPETAVNMSRKALNQALQTAGWDPLDLDFIIFATVSVGTNPGNHLIPSAACHLQQDIGAYNAFAYDLKAACSGWVYAMSQAIASIECGLALRGAVISTETQEYGLDYSDPSSSVLIGDIATATLVEKSKENNVLQLKVEANNHKKLKNIIELNDAKLYGENYEWSKPLFRIKGTSVFKEGTRQMAALVNSALSDTGLTVADVDYFIFHQANAAMLNRVAKMADIPDHKNLMNIHEIANTTAGTIPSVLHMFCKNGTIKRNNKILFVAFGGGITSGSILMKF